MYAQTHTYSKAFTHTHTHTHTHTDFSEESGKVPDEQLGGGGVLQVGSQSGRVDWDPVPMISQ